MTWLDISRTETTSFTMFCVAVAVHAMNGVAGGTSARISAKRLYAGRKS